MRSKLGVKISKYPTPRFGIATAPCMHGHPTGPFYSPQNSLLNSTCANAANKQRNSPSWMPMSNPLNTPQTLCENIIILNIIPYPNHKKTQYK